MQNQDAECPGWESTNEVAVDAWLYCKSTIADRCGMSRMPPNNNNNNCLQFKLSHIHCTRLFILVIYYFLPLLFIIVFSILFIHTSSTSTSSSSKLTYLHSHS